MSAVDMLGSKTITLGPKSAVAAVPGTAAAATVATGTTPAPIAAAAANTDSTRHRRRSIAPAALRRADSGADTIIVSNLFATPTNLAESYAPPSRHVKSACKWPSRTQPVVRRQRSLDGDMSPNGPRVQP